MEENVGPAKEKKFQDVIPINLFPMVLWSTCKHISGLYLYIPLIVDELKLFFCLVFKQGKKSPQTKL